MFCEALADLEEGCCIGILQSVELIEEGYTTAITPSARSNFRTRDLEERLAGIGKYSTAADGRGPQ